MNCRSSGRLHWLRCSNQRHFPTVISSIRITRSSLAYNGPIFMEAILIKLTAVFYLIAAVRYCYFIFKKDTTAKLPSVTFLLGFALNTVALAASFNNEGFSAVALLGEALIFKSWLMVGLYLLIQLKYRLTVLGGIVT